MREQHCKEKRKKERIFLGNTSGIRERAGVRERE
jgi:hypothetical protein